MHRVNTCECCFPAGLLSHSSLLQSDTAAGSGQVVERRKGHGSVAIRSVPICANLFPLKVLLDSLYHYDVSFATTRSRARGLGACPAWWCGSTSSGARGSDGCGAWWKARLLSCACVTGAGGCACGMRHGVCNKQPLLLVIKQCPLQ